MTQPSTWEVDSTSDFLNVSTAVNSTLSFDNQTLTTPSFTETDNHVESLLVYVSYVIVPLFFILGIGGNILTVLITRRKLYKHSSHGVFLRTIALNDIVFLLTFPFNKHFVHDLVGFDVRSISIVGCKVYFALYRASRISSALFMLQICIERFIVVCYPMKAKVFSTKRMALILVFSTFTVVACFTGAWTTAVNICNGRCLPVKVTNENEEILNAFSITGTILRTFFPATMLLIFTPLTVIKLYSQRNMRRQMAQIRGADETYRTTLMLLSVVIAFLVLTVPFCILKHVLLFNGVDIVTSTFPWAKTLYELSQLCEQTDCVINFIIYVCASSSFRWHLISIFKPPPAEITPAFQMSTVSTRDL